jgi:hypothetical protein
LGELEDLDLDPALVVDRELVGLVQALVQALVDLDLDPVLVVDRELVGLVQALVQALVGQVVQEHLIQTNSLTTLEVVVQVPVENLIQIVSQLDRFDEKLIKY